MRRLVVISAVVATLALVGQAAIASSVHLKGGRNAEPTFADNGLTLTAASALAGLGNQDIQVTLTAGGPPAATCTNPRGKKQPPRQEPPKITPPRSPALPPT